MKSIKYILLLVVALTALGASAKPLKTNQVYMFGFSASFKDSVIYVTDIQNVPGTWVESKNKFLLLRDEYSRQMKDYLEEKLQQEKRVCVVFYYLKKKKAEKEFLKLMKKYKKGYEIRHVNEKDFKFEAIDVSEQQ
jgi:hypothetical protein